MTNWIKGHFDFGAPYVSLLLNLRSPLGRKFHKGIAEIGNDNVERAMNYVTAFVIEHRPDIKNPIVIGLILKTYGQWAIQVISHSLERVREGSYREERFELCPVCKKPLSMEKQWLRPVSGTSEIVCEEVCSEECSKGTVPNEIWSEPFIQTIAGSSDD